MLPTSLLGRVCVMAFVLATAVGRADAGSITTIHGYSFSGTTAVFDTASMSLFDPALGTLDSVAIDILGNLTVITVPTPVPLPPPPAGPGGFAPYDYQINVTHDLSGLTGNLFDYAPEAEFIFAGATFANGAPIVHSRFFTIGFEFTDITDLIGFAPVSTTGVEVPPFAVAQRSDFIEDPFELNLLNVLFTATFVQGAPAPVSLSGGGSIQVTYKFTEFPEPPAAVPEPASMLLLGTGMAGVIGRRWRQRRRP